LIDDLYDVASLAAYWDTLGWVYFKKGDLDTAEKYIKAAWMVEQHGDIGYHLGMIAEKRGKKDAAIRLYAQSAAATRPAPEGRIGVLRWAPYGMVDKLIETAKKELTEYNVINMGQLAPNPKAQSQAEFYVVFGPDAARSAQVLDVQFIKGDDGLKLATPALKSLKYLFVFPDSAPTKIIRRGTLHCGAKPGGCTFTMISPDLITSVD